MSKASSRPSVADLLEEIVKGWLQDARGQAGSEEEEQRRVREAVMKCAGTIEGRPDLAENARSEVRARIAPRVHGL